MRPDKLSGVQGTASRKCEQISPFLSTSQIREVIVNTRHHKNVMFCQSTKGVSMGTRLMSATEVAEQLGTSKAYAYKVIRKLNAELAKKGCLIVQRKVSRMYFEERYFAGEPVPVPGEGASDVR